MHIVHIAARDINLVPEPTTFNSKKVVSIYRVSREECARLQENVP